MKNSTSIQSVLDELRSTLDAYPREQIAELVARREESVPELLKIFDDHEALVDDVVHGREITPFFAMYILAHLQETKFCPVLLQVLSIEFEDRDEFDAFWGDLLFEDAASILFSVYDGNHQALTDFILNSKNSHETRSVVLTTLGMAYAHEKINRSILVDVIQKAFAMEKDSEEELNFVLSEACMLVLECQLAELKADAVWMIENKLHGFCKVEELEQGLAIEPQKARADYLANPRNQRIQDIEDSVTWWFQKTIEPEYLEEAEEMMEYGDYEDRPSSIPFVREEPKVGRNDNCPCGSGKKFKKCCGK